MSAWSSWLVRAVGRDRDHVQSVNLSELVFFGLGCSGHAGQLVVQAEQVLERDRRDGLALALDLDPFLGFEGLVEAVAEAATEHHSTRVLIDDDDLAGPHDVFDVLSKSAYALTEALAWWKSRGSAAMLSISISSLDSVHAFLGEVSGVVLFVGGVVDFRL